MLRFATTLMIASLALGGCASQSVSNPHVTNIDPSTIQTLWPPAPETPRIRHLQTISAARDIGIRPGFLRKIALFLKGEEEKAIVRPQGLTTDQDGRLYVVDTFHRRVHMFDPAKGIHRLFPVTPPPDFVNPIGVAADTLGRIYVSDSVAKTIHVFSANGERYEGQLGKGLLQRPTGIAFDAPNRRLLVTDTVAASLVIFPEQALAPASIVGARAEGKFHAPTHVAVTQDGNVVVTDSLNFRVQVLDRDLRLQRSFGAAGDGPGYFSRPKGIAVDSEGHVYVVDALFGNVQIFDLDGNLLMAFGKNGIGPGEFWLPNDIFIDRQDRVYVSDAYNQRVQMFQYLRHGTEAP